MSELIILLTDFGSSDYYSGMMKGVIKGIIPNAEIIDLSHNIEPQNIGQAAFLLANSYKYFPKDSIFVTVVDPGVGTERKGIIVKADGRYFIGPDNGFMTFILQETGAQEVIEINSSIFLDAESRTFHGRDVFACVAARVLLGYDTSLIGNEVNQSLLVEFTDFPLILSSKHIKEAVIVMIDNYGNLITNVYKSALKKNMESVFSIRIEFGGIIINDIKETFADTQTGEFLAYIGSMGFLEIALNCGNAAKVTGAKTGGKIPIFL
jgi:S-adenosyl-L-methionine hydrolase (adenosine-forming)